MYAADFCGCIPRVVYFDRGTATTSLPFLLIAYAVLVRLSFLPGGWKEYTESEPVPNHAIEDPVVGAILQSFTADPKKQV